jgi:DNA-binding beta-propeller fold protein YncE
MINLATGIIQSVAGTGSSAYNGDGIPATEASLAGPSGLAVGMDGTLYIADTFNGRIRAIHPLTGIITTVVGDGGEYRYQGEPSDKGDGGPALEAGLSYPFGIVVDRDAHLLVADTFNHRIREVTF